MSGLAGVDLARPANRRADRMGVAPGLVVVLAVAALLRLPTIAQQSYWVDEAATLKVLHHSFTGMFAAIARRESTPPLYDILAWGWTRIFGFSEAGVRSLSAVFGIATVWVVYRACERVSGRRAAVVASLLCAVNPLMVWYSQEARAYALLAFFGALTYSRASATVVGAPERTRGRAWSWALAAILGLCTHYFAVFYVAPELAWLLWRRRRAMRGPAVAVVAASLALLPLALVQRASGHTDWITGTPLSTRLLLIPKQFATGLSAPHQTALAAVVLLAALSAIVAVLLDRGSDAGPGARAAIAIPAAGLAGMAVLALAGVDLVLTRNALGVLPVVLIALGCGIDLLARRRAVVAALVLVGTAGVGIGAVAAVVTDPRYQRTDWRAAAHVITEDTRAHLVVLDPASDALALSPYIALRPAPRRDRRTREIDVVRFLLTTQGGSRRVDAVRVVRGFRRVAARRWPDLEAERYVAGTPRRPGAAGSQVQIFEVSGSRGTAAAPRRYSFVCRRLSSGAEPLAGWKASSRRSSVATCARIGRPAA